MRDVDAVEGWDTQRSTVGPTWHMEHPSSRHGDQQQQQLHRSSSGISSSHSNSSTNSSSSSRDLRIATTVDSQDTERISAGSPSDRATAEDEDRQVEELEATQEEVVVMPGEVAATVEAVVVMVMVVVEEALE